MKRSFLAASLLTAALTAATAQAGPAVDGKEAKPEVTPKKSASALTTRAQRSEVKKHAAELKKKQTENAAANQGK